MTDEIEKLFLKSNDFQDLARSSFAELRADTDFTDVTLACEDQSIKAHKVILSACSPFFKKLLKNHPHPQPLIYMRGMKLSDLNAIVDFIYLGEVNVFQDQLETFLALTEELQLKGLDDSSEEKTSEYPMELPSNGRRTDLNERQNTTDGLIPNLVYGGNTFEGIVMKNQPKLKQTSLIEPKTIARIEMMIEKGVEGYSWCTKCGYKTKQLAHMREHVEKHIEGLEYPCKFCSKVLKSSNSLRVHKSRCVLSIRN